ncbi:RmlC-like cupin domain-containing protein [Crucibulum laeve]|uniref:RmlC-like cupin domain-containing protein n=1 Tax=Crucibulum laeve TaxID=68775 RepID=A0A5C3LIB4_9AGAR|nr:RmlC-like cupin domain-containing protein [Crucibulum laeve]
MTQPQAATDVLIEQLGLQKHPEGGYYVETDRQVAQVPSPFANQEKRSLATSIYYLLTKDSPSGVIHLNKSVTYHVLHHGRAEYTLITPGSPPTVEKKVMGTNVTAGETRLLLVGTGIWKMSRLLPEDLADDKRDNEGCLITEVVVPGFHWEDHQFLTKAALEELFKGAEGGEDVINDLLPHVKKIA